MPKVNHINYEEIGSGEPLLLLMGLGADGSVWEKHVHEYKKNFRCILIDNRGAGKSDTPEEAFSTLDMANDAVMVMDHLSIEQFNVAGISMGGAIAQHIAADFPARVKNAVIISSWAVCDDYTKRIFEMFKVTRKTLSPCEFAKLLNLWIFSPQYQNENVYDLIKAENESEKDTRRMSYAAFVKQCDACINHNTIHKLENITAKTLITVGDRDIFTPLLFSRQLEKKIENSRLAIFNGGAHTHHWEYLNEFNELTSKFLLGESLG